MSGSKDLGEPLTGASKRRNLRSRFSCIEICAERMTDDSERARLTLGLCSYTDLGEYLPKTIGNQTEGQAYKDYLKEMTWRL